MLFNQLGDCIAAFFAPEARRSPDGIARGTSNIFETTFTVLKRFGRTLVFATFLQYNGWTLVSVLSAKQAGNIAAQLILAVDGSLGNFSSGKLKAL
tara:strand:+ start:1221 stop:1508 length:288 start_codon:yes stop_codon:yes gene_type:complete